MKLTIVGKSNCPWCEKALQRADHSPCAVEYISLDENDTAKKIMRLHGHETVPQVFYQGHLTAPVIQVGGYEDMVEFLKPSQG